MKCSKCNNKMTQLLTSWVCDCESTKTYYGHDNLPSQTITRAHTTRRNANLDSLISAIKLRNPPTNWRDFNNEGFFTIDFQYSAPELRNFSDVGQPSINNLYTHGNYFRTQEQALEASQEIKLLLAKLHQKWGE